MATTAPAPECFGAGLAGLAEERASTEDTGVAGDVRGLATAWDAVTRLSAEAVGFGEVRLELVEAAVGAEAEMAGLWPDVHPVTPRAVASRIVRVVQLQPCRRRGAG